MTSEWLSILISWHVNRDPRLEPKAKHVTTDAENKYITLTSWYPRWRLKSPASRLFTQSFIRAQIKENIKNSRHWPLCGEFTGTGEFPAQRASNAKNVSIWWSHFEITCHISAMWAKSKLWEHCPNALSSLSCHCNSLDDRGPDFFCKYLLLKWIVIARLQKYSLIAAGVTSVADNIWPYNQDAKRNAMYKRMPGHVKFEER